MVCQLVVYTITHMLTSIMKAQRVISIVIKNFKMQRLYPYKLQFISKNVRWGTQFIHNIEDGGGLQLLDYSRLNREFIDIFY